MTETNQLQKYVDGKWVPEEGDIQDWYEYDETIDDNVEHTLVYSAFELRRETQFVRAVKRYEFSDLDETYNDLFQHEIEAYIKVGPHPNIMKYIGAYKDELYGYLILEYMTEWNLFTTYVDPETSVENTTTSVLIHFIKDMVAAISHLHAKKLCHRDIKLENVIFDKDENAYKLLDFQFVGKDLEKQYVGTPRCISPEILQWDDLNPEDKPILKSEDLLMSDMWSFGVMLCQLIFSGKVPYDMLDYEDRCKMRKQIVSFRYRYNDNSYTEQDNYVINKVLYLCLQLDKDNRFTAHDLSKVLDFLDYHIKNECPERGQTIC